MKTNKILAAVFALTLTAGATMPLGGGATSYSMTAAALNNNVIDAPTVDDTTKAAVTSFATTTKAAATTTAKASVTNTSAAVTTSAKPMKTATTLVTSSSVTTSTTTPVVKDIISGDANNDGRIDAIDASIILSHYALTSSNQNGILTEAQLKNADINNDGIVNAIDASTVLAIYAKNSVQSIEEASSSHNNPIHDFSMNYDIDLSTPTWEGNDCDKFGGDYKMSESFPSAEKLNNLLSNSFIDLSDYRCVATIVHNARSAYGKGYRTVELEHIFLDNDITELKGRWNNGKTGITFTNIGFACLKQHTRISDKESEWYRQTSVGIGSSSAIYTNIPIVLDDGTVLEPHKAVPLEIIKNVQITEDSGKKAVTLDNYSSYSKTFTVPEWYDIDLRNPAWEGINTETNERCDKFGGDFRMNEIFPSNELINNALSLKVGGRDNYKCVATIVRNTSRSRGAGRQITLEHLFVENDVNELKGRWDNNQKNGIAFTNVSYACGNLVNIKSYAGEVGWSKSSSYGLGVGAAIYTNIPIVLDDGTIIEPYFMYGDVNDDGVIDIEDARMIVDFLNGDIELPDDRARKAADVNRDGIVDEKDITDSEGHINGEKPINDSNIINNDNDSDSDGLTDLEEYKLGTKRFNPDTDGDGLKDGYEININTNPLVSDSDGDGYTDICDPDPVNPPEYLNGQYDFLDGEIYYIQPFDLINFDCIEVDNSSSLKCNCIYEDGNDDQKFRFKWSNHLGIRGYKICSLNNENLVLTLQQNADKSYSVCMSNDETKTEQLWEVLPYEKTKGLLIRSKVLHNVSEEAICKPLFLTYNDDQMLTVSADMDTDTVFSLKSLEEKWSRFGMLYMEQQGWIERFVPYDKLERALENYKYNSQFKDYSENEYTYTLPDGHTVKLLINQLNGAFTNMYYAERYEVTKMSNVICEVMATYNALNMKELIANDPDYSKFLKMCVEFEVQALQITPPAGDYKYEGAWGSNPEKIAFCLNAYNASYKTINKNDYLLNSSPVINDYESACNAFDDKLNTGTCGILSYNFQYKFSNDLEKNAPNIKEILQKAGISEDEMYFYLPIHTYAVVYDESRESESICTFNYLCSRQDFVPYASTNETLKNDEGHFIIGYILD